MGKVSNPTPKLCALCDRPVGLIRPGVARPYRNEITDDGVSALCTDTRSCKLAASRKAAS